MAAFSMFSSFCRLSLLSSLRPNSRCLINSHFLLRASCDADGRQGIHDDASGPQPPKRPLAGYMRYVVENRDSIMQNIETGSGKGVNYTKLASSMWNALTKEEHEAYTAEYTKNLAVYKEQMATFLGAMSPEERQMYDQAIQDKKQMRGDKKQMRSVRKHKKEIKMEIKMAGRPHRPATAWNRFLKSKLHGLTFTGPDEMTLRDKFLKAGEEWRKMSEADKLEFQQATLDERQKYNQELQEWEEKMIREGKLQLIRKVTQNKEKTRTKNAERKSVSNENATDTGKTKADT